MWKHILKPVTLKCFAIEGEQSSELEHTLKLSCSTMEFGWPGYLPCLGCPQCLTARFMEGRLHSSFTSKALAEVCSQTLGKRVISQKITL